MKSLFCYLSFLLMSTVYGQNLSIPDEIQAELETVVIETEIDTITLRVAYPDNYDKNKEYDCFLGLSGGKQSMEIVNYCYAAWFRSGYFNDYLTVLPVAARDTIQFSEYSVERIENMLNAINEHFRVSEKWLIAGTSDGGNAAFNFVSVAPERFEGIITAPGKLSATIVPDQSWSHLKVILCYGEEDAKTWIKAVKSSYKTLKKIVSKIDVIKLEEQGHILSISFNADKMYDPYFLEMK